MKIFILIIVIMISTSVPAKKIFYKWTDENGNIHYTLKKSENKKMNEIKVNTSHPKVSSKVEATEEVEKEESKAKIYFEKKYENKQKVKKLALNNKNKCLKARQTVTKYQQKVRMSRIDKESGETIYLEDSKRAEFIKDAKKRINKYCK